MLLTWANICCVLKSRKPYKHLHSRSCWENKKLLRYFKPMVTFQFRHVFPFLLSKKTLYSFTMLPSSSFMRVLSRLLSSLSYVTWRIFHSDTFPQFIPSHFPVIKYTSFLSGFAVPHPGQRQVTLRVNKQKGIVPSEHLCSGYGMFSISPLQLFISHNNGFAKLYTKFDGTTLLKLLPVHFRNAPHKHNFTSDALNNRVATAASSNLY